MKNILLEIIIMAICISVVLPVVAVSAADFGLEEANKIADLPKDIKGQTTTAGILGLVINVALSFLGFIFFGLMLYAGILWMTARGDSATVEKAKEIMIAAIIGLVIVASAYAITIFIFENLSAGAPVPAVPPAPAP